MMRRIIKIIAVAVAAALLIGGIWYVKSTGAYRYYDGRPVII